MRGRRTSARSRAEAEHELVPSRPVFLFCVLAVLTGLASFLANIYECRRKPLVALEKAPLDGLQCDRPARPTEERASKRPSDFSRLCESIKDLPPKEQAEPGGAG